MWPFKSKTPSRASFPIDIYRLDAPIARLSGLVEFSANQYETMGGRIFEGERNYNAPAIKVFGDKKWNVMLQTVDGFISKITINVLLNTEREANQVAMQLFGYCMKELGKPNEGRPGFAVWDTTDGNFILQTGETADGLAVALFLTSKSIRNFKKRADNAPTLEVTKSFDDAAKPDDTKKLELANGIAGALAAQKMMAGNASIKDEHGNLKRKALGYVYGFTDAALRVKGYDMADVSVGVPITFQIIRRLWPDDVNECMDYLINNLSKDALLMAGVMRGGQQVLDYRKPDAPGIPTGLGIFLLKGDKG